MKIRTAVKAGEWHDQHNEKLLSGRNKKLTVKTGIKVGDWSLQHNEKHIGLKNNGFTSIERRGKRI